MATLLSADFDVEELTEQQTQLEPLLKVFIQLLMRRSANRTVLAPGRNPLP